MTISPRPVIAKFVKDSTFFQQGYNRKFVVGTYILSTFLNGDFVGRRVITLTQDGNFFVIDSNQGGTKGVPTGAQFFSNNRFTDRQGTGSLTIREIIDTTFHCRFPTPKVQALSLLLKAIIVSNLVPTT